MTEEERYKLIDAYLKGDLTEAQRTSIERLRTEDASFQKELDEHLELREALGPSQVNAFRQMVGEVIKQNQARKKKKGFSLQYLIAIAAAVALLLIAWQVLKPEPDTPEELFSRSFNPPALVAILRNAETISETEPTAQIQKEIDSLYRRKNYQEALSRLNAYGNQFPETRSSDFYYWSGLLFLLTDQADRALEAFSQVETGYPYDKPWHIALTYLKTGDRRRAQAAFSAIAQSESPYREEAATILKALGAQD